jgi:hypothetical protein
MDMRETLLDLLGKLRGHEPWPAETKLAVVVLGPGRLSVDNGKKWVAMHRRRPMREPGESSLTVDPAVREEREGRTMERMLARSAARVKELEEAAAQAREMEKLRVD